MRVRKEVMKAYSRKVRNNDGFIICDSAPQELWKFSLKIGKIAPWQIWAIFHQPSIRYGWFWYSTGMRPKGLPWATSNICIYHSLGVETVASWISEIQDFSLSRGSYACTCARQIKIWVDIMILGTLMKKWCIYWSESIWGSGKKLWRYIVEKCEITMGL